MNSKMVWLLVLSMTAACGVDELGVRSVGFDLRPTPVPEVPAGIDVGAVAAIQGASGSLEVDVHADDLHIELEGLPALPDGFAYVAMADFAEHERAAIPGDEAEDEAGHSHGALTRAGDVLQSEGHVLETVSLGELEPGAEVGHWEIELSSEEVGGRALGAIRASMVMLVPASGAAVGILAGEVGQEQVAAGAGGEEGGHEHGP